MSDTNVYGPLVSAKQIERRIIGSLEDWLPFYLGEMERLDGYAPDEIARPEGYVRAAEFAKWPEDALPVILVIAAETDRPIRHEDGKHQVAWTVGVAPIVKDQSEVASRDLATTYAAAIRGAVVQHKRLRSVKYPDGIQGSVEWIGEGYHDLNFDLTRTLGSARVVFSVGIDNAVQSVAGPRDIPAGPPSEDPGPWPQVKKIDVKVNPVEVLP